jgi:hypothetical protein
MTRHPMYKHNNVTSNLKCHGSFSFSKPASFFRSSVSAVTVPEMFGVSISLEHSGHRPSAVIAEGAKYRAQGSHHGMI